MAAPIEYQTIVLNVPSGVTVTSGRTTLTYVVDPNSPFRGITRTDSALLESPTTFGDTTYKNHPYLHSWVISDLSGGIGVEDITGADTNRYRWGTADARSPGNITLGPLVTKTRPTSDDTDTLYPVGDVPGTNEEFYVCVTEVSQVTNNLYAWNEATDSWRAASLDIDGHPMHHSVRFQGTNANAYLVIPRGAGASSAIAVRTTGAGTLASSVVSPGGNAPALFAEWDGRLWAINGSGATLYELYYTFDLTTWTAVTDPRTGNTLTLGQGDDKEPWAFFPWYNLAGESTLYVLTKRALYALNLDAGRWETVYDIPPHTVKYRPAEVWRTAEDLWIGIGGSIIRRTPAGVTVPLAGPGADADGLPDGFLGTVLDLAPEFNGLYCILSPLTGNVGSVLVYTGAGWHPIWEETTNEYGQWLVVSGIGSGTYRLWWGSASYAHTIKLRQGPWSARQGFNAGVDEFNASSYLETGRFWAQLYGQDKIAVMMDVFMENATSTETLTVKYQTDTVTSWTTLGSAITTGRNNGTYQTTLRFGTADSDGVNPGLAFQWIKFRFEFARGSTITNTPILNAAVLRFLKVRDNTPGFQVSLAFPDIMPDGRTANEAIHDLEDLVTANAIITFKYGHHIHGAWIAGLSGPEASGADGRGARTLTLVSLEEAA